MSPVKTHSKEAQNYLQNLSKKKKNPNDLNPRIMSPIPRYPKCTTSLLLLCSALKYRNN